MEFTEGAATGGQVTSQSGFLSLVPNYFTQIGSAYFTGWTSMNSPFTSSTTTSSTNLLQLLNSRRPESLDPVLSNWAIGFLDRKIFLWLLPGAAGEQLEEVPEATPGPENNGQPPAGPEPVIPGQLFVIPPLGVSRSDLLQDQDPNHPGEPILTAISENEYRLLPDEPSVGLEERKLGPVEVLTACLLAAMPEWLPPRDRTKRQRQTFFAG